MNIRWNNPDWIQPESGSLVIVLVGAVMHECWFRTFFGCNDERVTNQPPVTVAEIFSAYTPLP